MLSKSVLEQLKALSVQESDSGDGASFGLFNRNMVVSGRSCLDPLTPAYQEAAGSINLPELSGYPETFGELVDQADASAIVVAPTGNDLASKTTYWTASATGNYILYSHPHLARTIRAYSFITEASYTPATWSLLGSNNGTDWTTLHSGTAPEWGAGKNQVDEDIDSGNIAPYLYHKLVISTFDDGVTAVRIYALQLWTDGITTQLGVRAFADATDPLVIAFGNGETVEEVSLTSPLSVTIDPTSAPHLPPSGASAYSLLAYAEYDPLSQETVLGAEPLNVDDFIDLGQIRTELASLGWSTGYSRFYPSGDEYKLFNGVTSDYWATSNTASAYSDVRYWFLSPINFYLCGYYLIPYFNSTSYGGTWTVEYYDGESWLPFDGVSYGTAQNGQVCQSHQNPVVAKGVRVLGYKPLSLRELGLKELKFYVLDIPGIGTAGRKFGNGIVQIYDSIEEEWVQKCRVYLGITNMGKGLDGEWAVNGFVPFNMPPQNLVPFPKATFPARW